MSPFGTYKISGEFKLDLVDDAAWQRLEEFLAPLVDVTFDPDAPEGHFVLRRKGRLVIPIPDTPDAWCRFLVPKRFEERLLEAGEEFDEPDD